MQLEQLKRANHLLIIFSIITITSHMVNGLCDNSPANKNKHRGKNKVEKVHKALKMDEKDSKIVVLRNAEFALSATDPENNQMSLNNSVDSNNSSYSLTDDAEELLKMTAEDLKIQEEWGGNCTAKHWDKCKCVRTWFGYYEDESDLVNKEKNYEIDCFVEPVICMKNGWTVSRCHLLCMGGCNKGYVPSADYPENPDLPEPESIKNVKRSINRGCFCGVPGSEENKETDQVKDDLLAKPFENPWTVYLRINNSLPGKYSRRDKPLRGRTWTWAEREGHHDCVGTVINDLFILTSSGCILNYYPDEDSPLSKQLPFEMEIKKTREIQPSEVYVYVNITHKQKGVLQKYLVVEKIFYHAQTSYATRNFRSAEENDYDIALLKLKNRLKFGPHPTFTPICLPTPALIKDYNFMYTFANGWFSRPPLLSYLFNAKENLDKLHELKVGSIFDNCEDIFQDDVKLPNYLCSHNPLDYMDAGSSLVAKTKNNRIFLLGVLSWIVPHISGDLTITQNQDSIDRNVPYGLFSKIVSKPIQSFIDYHSKREGAHWCVEPDNVQFEGRPFKGYNDPLPVDEPSNILNTCECGVSNPKESARKAGASPRVVGGEETNPYEFPWLVWIAILKDDTTFGCGATIINDRLLLTAAHCVTLEAKNGLRTIVHPSKINAVLHTHDPQGEIFGGKPNDYKLMKIERVIVHEGYIKLAPKYEDKHVHDIALMVLPEKLDLTDPRFTPICLPRRHDTISITEDRLATVAGWGLIHRKPEILARTTQKLNVPLHTVETCKAFYSIGYGEQFICADQPYSTSGAAQGDSGGPLFLELPSKHQIQIGVVSYGVHGTRPSTHWPNELDITFYTRVTFFLSWIESYSAAYDAVWCSRLSDPT